MTMQCYDYELDLGCAIYPSDPTNIALFLIIASGDEQGEPFGTLTVNLGNEIGNGVIMPRSCGFVDVNDFPGAARFIEENGLGEPYLRFGEPVRFRSGFVEYPLFKFDERRLEELDPKGFGRYKAQYADSFKEALSWKHPQIAI